MKLTSFIPPEYRLAAIAAAALAIAVSAFVGGWKVSSWKAEAASSEKVAECTSALALRDLDVVGLKAAVATQNAAVDKLRQDSEAALAAQEAARQEAVQAAKSSARRLAALQKLIEQGATPEKVMQAYWEMSR